MFVLADMERIKYGVWIFIIARLQKLEKSINAKIVVMGKCGHALRT